MCYIRTCNGFKVESGEQCRCLRVTRKQASSPRPQNLRSKVIRPTFTSTTTINCLPSTPPCPQVRRPPQDALSLVCLPGRTACFQTPMRPARTAPRIGCSSFRIIPVSNRRCQRSQIREQGSVRSDYYSGISIESWNEIPTSPWANGRIGEIRIQSMGDPTATQNTLCRSCANL